MTDKAERDAYFEGMKVPLWKVYLRDEGMCHLCGKPVQPYDASRDHVIPASEGGPTTWDNIRLAHRQCNSERGSVPLGRLGFKGLEDLLEQAVQQGAEGPVNLVQTMKHIAAEHHKNWHEAMAAGGYGPSAFAGIKFEKCWAYPCRLVREF